jgi:hypothetical protein
MQWDSIKTRLGIMTIFCVIGLLGQLFSQHYFNEQLILLNQQRVKMLLLSNDLLQMRRHEKDFLLRQEEQYVELFDQRAMLFKQRLGEVSLVQGQLGLDVDLSINLSQSFAQYQQVFHQLVRLQGQLTMQDKLRFIHQVDAIEGLLPLESGVSDGQLVLSLTTIKVNTLQYQLSRQPKYADEVIRETELLLHNLALPMVIRNAIHLFAEDFTRYQQALVTMGKNHHYGLQGKFRQQAHQVERQLQSIEQALSPLIANKQRAVERYSLMIALTTSLALVLLLVKSFATFHRAFTYFVMFFYRSKREYQKIDSRKLGFSEFRSLAELANEMVESRQRAETQLASMKIKKHAVK